MRKIFVLISFVATILSFGQGGYVKGYIVNLEKQKIDCYFKNKEYSNTPNQFEYKLEINSDTSEFMLAKVDNVLEVFLDNNNRYLVSEVAIDLPITNTSQENTSKMPEFQNKRIFLQVLAEGKINLYVNYQSDITRFFIKTDSIKIEQLINNQYTKNYQLFVNHEYKNQFARQFAIDDLDWNKINNLQFNTKSLLSFVKDYNASFGNTRYLINKAKGNFVFSVLTAYFSSTVISKDAAYGVVLDKKSILNTAFGFRGEFFYNSKLMQLSTYIDVLFDKQKSNIGMGIYGKEAQLQFNTLDVNLGFRRRYYLNSVSAFRFSIGFGAKINLNSSCYFKSYNFAQDNNRYRQLPPIGFLIGLGYVYKNINLDIHYKTSNENFYGSLYLDIARKNIFGIVLGYQIFSSTKK